MINKKPEKCQRCGETEFIESETSYKCKSCGKNHGKNAFKTWTVFESNGGDKFNEEGRIRKKKADIISSTRKDLKHVKDFARNPTLLRGGWIAVVIYF